MSTRSVTAKRNAAKYTKFRGLECTIQVGSDLLSLLLAVTFYRQSVSNGVVITTVALLKTSC